MSSADQLPLFSSQPKPQGQARQSHSESRWLSLEQIRKQQRCRRSVVIAAMESGALPHEQRGRIRYARICDVQAWEQARLTNHRSAARSVIHPDLKKFI